MSRRRFIKGPRCDVSNCKSTLYYAMDGLTFCQNNHQAHGVLEYEIDEDEAMSGGFGSRRKRGREVKRSAVQSRVIRGKAGFAVYLQAYQLIMRHQAAFITRTLVAQDFGPCLKQFWQRFLELQDARDKLPELAESDEEEDVDMDTHTPSESQDEPESASESGSDFLTREQDKTYKSARYTMHRPLLIHTIALTYLTLLMFRVPITVHHLKSWIDKEEFPYMRAIRYLPKNLLEALEPQYHEALDPQIRPRASRIWKWIQQTAIYFQYKTNIRFPTINYRPILFTSVQNMLLPVDVYNAVDTQLKLLKIELSVTSDLKNPLLRIPPECRVLCLTLVIAKLFYNLDGTPRTSKTRFEPPTRGPDIDLWHRTIKKMISAIEGIDHAAKIVPRDVFTMTESAMDEYLDWFGKTWITTADTSLAISQGLLSMFPVSNTDTDTDTDNLAARESTGDDRDASETMRWLYSSPNRPNARQSDITPGDQYRLTSAENTGQECLFDDLISLASLQNSIADIDLRKHIRWLELRLHTKTVQSAWQPSSQSTSRAEESSSSLSSSEDEGEEEEVSDAVNRVNTEHEDSDNQRTGDDES